MTEKSIIPTIKAEAKRFTNEYFKNPTEKDHYIILNAMLHATNICLKKQNEEISSEIEMIKNL